MHTGSCLCGEVRFHIEAELAPIQVCHCSQCRKAQGGAFATNTPVAVSHFRLDQGAEFLNAFESSPGKKRVFCRKCGSPIYSRRDAMPDVLRIRAGLLDEPLAARPAVHFHTRSKCDWWTIGDDLPQFADAYPPKA